MTSLQYPIGPLSLPDDIDASHIAEWIGILEAFPNQLRTLVQNLNESQLDTRYRPGGWTVRQVVHHCADSHHHSYIRFKWALTEANPRIKAYQEQDWAELFDSRTAPIELSLKHLDAVHAKLVYLLKGLTNEELSATFIHPETNKTVSLKENIANYAWHSQHHYAHIEQLMIREGWK